MTFFDITKQSDINLIHKSVREDDELSNVVEQVEWEVIDYYKQRPSIPIYFRSGLENISTLNQVVVRLFDYRPDDPSESDEELLEALRRTVADVTSWILRNYNVEQGGVREKQQGKRSVTFMGSAPSWREWPEGWNRRLSNFDNRDAVYSI